MAQARRQQHSRSNPLYSTTIPTEHSFHSTPQQRTQEDTFTFADSQQAASPWQLDFQPQLLASRRPRSEGTSSLAFYPDDPQDKTPHILPNVPPSQPIPNIPIFSDNGIEKSPLINLASGRAISVVPSDTLNHTFGNTSYEAPAEDTPPRQWDAAELDEGEQGHIPAEGAMTNDQGRFSGLQDAVNPLGPNIIVFGETGSGKSSLINMLFEGDRAEVSSSANGVTFQSTQHSLHAYGRVFNFFDTAGLDEGDGGTVPKQEAIVQLFRLMKNLRTGVSLLVFVMRGPRIKEAAYRNWRMFYEVFCQKQVPITLAITGLENEDDMDAWWPRNKGAFQKYGLNPSGFACITATKGRLRRSGEYSLAFEYEESKQKVWDMILNHYLENPWKMATVEWFSTVVTTTYSSRFCRSPKEHTEVRTAIGPGIRGLVERCAMSEEEARQLAAKLS